MGFSFEKYDLIKESIIKTLESDVFRDISQDFITFLLKDKKLKKLSFIIWHIAGRGWGKTSISFSEINIILKDNPKRFVQFLKAPEQLITNINNACPEDLKGRFKSIFKIRDIRENAILVIDEGLLGVNAKEALKIEMRNLTKFLSKSRHPNIIVIVNSVNLNILSEFRDMVDIIIYKHLPISFIKNNSHRDPFLMDYLHIISRLREWEGILVSNFKGFEKIGKISIKYEDHCPWFNDNISRYHRETNPDVNYDDNTRIQNNNKKIARKIIHEIGDTFEKKSEYDLFEAWLCDTHPDIHYDNKTHLPMIFKFYRYFLNTDYLNGNYPEEELIEIEYKEKESFSDFVKRIIPDDKIARVAEGLVRGDSYRTIDDNNKDFGYAFVQKTANWLRNKANYNFGLGYLFEKWCAYNIGVPENQINELIGGSNKNKPDLIWENNIYSFKFRINERTKLKYRQSVDLAPEYNEAKKRGQNYYFYHLNPKWSLKLEIIELDPFNNLEEFFVEKPKKPYKKLIM